MVLLLGFRSCFLSLPKQGAELERKDCRGWTALFHCTGTGHQQMVKFLLDNHADANVKWASSLISKVMWHSSRFSKYDFLYHRQGAELWFHSPDGSFHLRTRDHRSVSAGPCECSDTSPLNFLPALLPDSFQSLKLAHFSSQHQWRHSDDVCIYNPTCIYVLFLCILLGSLFTSLALQNIY